MSIVNRQIFLDTETTGISNYGISYKRHRIIEIGAVEVINRCLTGQQFHVYINPYRLVDLEAFKIHGISNAFLKNKPIFADIADKFLNFIHGAELVIHNAMFDIGFIDYEFSILHIPPISTFCQITDSLMLARKLFPGKRNNLNALCDRYSIENSERKLHGALMDATILAKVYLAMTGGQTSLSFYSNLNLDQSKSNVSFKDINIDKDKQKDQLVTTSLRIIYANQHEIADHEEKLDYIEKNIGKTSIWRRLFTSKKTSNHKKIK